MGYNCLTFALFLFFSALCLLPGCGNAANANNSFGELILFQSIPEVISASRHTVSVVESPATSTVLTREDIAHSGAQTVAELLRFMSGITMFSAHSSDMNIGIRGVNGQQANNILVLVDGRPIYSPVRNTNQCLVIPETVEDIERVEVIRGPGSVLYGSHAFAGVINIVTRRPEDINGVDFSASMGTYDTHIYSLTGGFQNGPLSYKIISGWEQAGSWDDHDNHTRDLFKFAGQVTYSPDFKNILDLSWGATNGQLETFPKALKYSFDQEGFEGFVRGRYSRNLFFADVWWRRHDTSGEWFGKKITWQFDNINLLTQNGYNWKAHQLIYGAEIRLSKIKVTSYDDDHKQFLYSLFFEDRWRLSKDLDFFVGCRYDHHPLAGGAFSPRLSLVKLLGPNQSIRLTAAQAFKNPSYLQNYLAVQTPFFNQFGNKNLDQEKIRSYEIAYQLWNPQGISFLGAFFYNKYLDVIDMKFEQSEDVWGLRTQNSYDGKQYGVELDVSYRPSLTWLFRLNYSYIWKGKVRGATFGPVPTHQLNGEIRYDHPQGFWADLRIHWQDRGDYSCSTMQETSNIFPFENSTETGWQQIEAYTFGDFSIGYSPPRKNWNIVCGIHNIFHNLHKEYPLGEKVDTTITGRISFHF